MSESASYAVLGRFAVLANDVDHFHSPVSIDLGQYGIGYAKGGRQLIEITGGQATPVASQVNAGGGERLSWLLSGTNPAGTRREFEYREYTGETADVPVEQQPAVVAEENSDGITLSCHGRTMLNYRHAKSGVPEGVNPIYERQGGYLHPVNTPEGATITRIQPPDHYHHYGLWNPWTSTEIEGKKVDFWNLADKQGTVRSMRILEAFSGAVYGGFKASLDHVEVHSPEGERIVLREEWAVEAWPADEQGKLWAVDFTSTLNPCAGIPFLIKAYRYQGFGLRARADWGDSNATLLTSEGLDRSNANGTPARWMHIHGATEVPSGQSGALLMSHPLNQNFPEPIRIWPEGMNGGKENVFLNFNPAQEKDWELLPGQRYRLRYRIILHDGTMPEGWAEAMWKSHRTPLTVQPL